MIQAELQEEQQQIEDLEHQRVDYLNRDDYSKVMELENKYEIPLIAESEE